MLTPEQVQEIVSEVLASKKKASVQFSCKKCGQNQLHYAEIPDARAVTDALKTLLAEGFGRPAGEEDGDRIVFQRLVEMPVDASDST